MTADRQQATVAQLTDDGPAVGVEPDIDGRTHYAHARYAMAEQPGVIWYDPRDGREWLAFEGTRDDSALAVGEECVTSVTLHPHRGVCQLADPGSKWALKYQYKRREEHEKPRPSGVETYEVMHTYAGSDVFESVYVAREAARDRYDEYADAPYRNAVAHRVGGSDE